MAQLIPYLSFSDNCREAMNFYKDCLGGELTLQSVGEMPEMAAQMPASMKDSILHAQLKSGDIIIFGSDLSREKRVDGNTVQLCINCNSEEELGSFFSKLSAGGNIIESLRDMPWGAKFGALIDKYGKYWMFNFQKS